MIKLFLLLLLFISCSHLTNANSRQRRWCMSWDWDTKCGSGGLTGSMGVLWTSAAHCRDVGGHEVEDVSWGMIVGFDQQWRGGQPSINTFPNQCELGG